MLLDSKPERDIPELVRIVGRERGGERYPVGHHQRQILAIGRKPEVRVQRQARRPPILPGSEHDEVTIRREDRLRKRPFPPIPGIVREMPAGEVDGGGAEVRDFDPVFDAAVFIRQPGGVGGAEFGEAHLGQSRMDKASTRTRSR